MRPEVTIVFRLCYNARTRSFSVVSGGGAGEIDCEASDQKQKGKGTAKQRRNPLFIFGRPYERLFLAASFFVDKT